MAQARADLAEAEDVAVRAAELDPLDARMVGRVFRPELRR